MKKVLIAYYSVTGITEKMAEFIAEGVRFSGQEAIIKKTGGIKTETELAEYDGFIFGSPTYSLHLPIPIQTFISRVKKVYIKDKICGAFGSYTHDVSYQHDNFAPAIILDTLERFCSIRVFELGPLNLKEDVLKTREGMKACQDYGRVFGEKLDKD